MTLAGHEVLSSQSLAANPLDNVLWAILTTDDGSTTARRLVTVDPTTGESTLIGTLSDRFSYLAFNADGTLYGVTGDGADVPETLYTLSTTDATATFVMTLGNGFDGEVIAFHPNGLLYHSSGNIPLAVFESIDVNTKTVTGIGGAALEMFAMGYHPGLGQMFGSDISNNLFTINLTTGGRQFAGGMGDQLVGDMTNRGFAVVTTTEAVPEPSTLALTGTAGLATVAALVRRRRSGTA